MTRAQREVLSVLRAGGTVWKSRLPTERSAWLCANDAKPRRVRLATLHALEEAGLIAEDPNSVDATWQISARRRLPALRC